MMTSVKRNDWILIAVGIALVLGACLIVSLFIVPELLIDGGSVVQPPQSTLTAESTLACADRWAQIKARGVLRVGTSADYPPFEYYNEQFQIVGFDVALMNQIAQKLGLAVEYNDFAFEGLTAALLVGQIDAAISAMSVTPERQVMVDFSDPYYNGLDAVLVRTDSPITTISTFNQIAGYRVGVQSGTVYASMLKTGLVDTGLMPAANLLTYPRIDASIPDLASGRIDLVWLDQQPAGQFARSGGVKIISQGLNPQSYAVAACKGNTSMLIEINRALNELEGQGVLASLYNQYLNLSPNVTPPTPMPTATLSPAQPTPTPPAPPPCVHAMSFVSDLNLADNSMKNPPVLAAGQAFTKGWRIRNSGTCAWYDGYYLGYASGNSPAAQMGGLDTVIEGTVRPGELYDVYVDLVAPIQAGTYQGFWQMFSSIRYPFGERIWVGIRVNPPPTPTPKPTQTSSPNVSFTADRTSINTGEGVTFSWNVTGGVNVYFYAQGQDWTKFPVGAQANRIEYPPQSTTYELRAQLSNGTVEIRQIRITVVPPSLQAPVITRFDSSPAAQVTLGQCVTLQWSVTGQVTTVRLLKNNTEIWGQAPFSGSHLDCPSQAGQVVYGIEASGPGGVSRQQLSMQVVQPSPSDTPVPPAPQIEYFAVDPMEIQLGSCVNLSWRASGGVEHIEIYRGANLILDGAPFTGSGQDCPTAAGQVVYKLVASNSAGVSVTQEATVSVVAPPTNPVTGVDWKLVSYADAVGTMLPVQATPQVRLILNQSGILEGNGGCNEYNGPYKLEGRLLEVGDLVLTKQACEPPAVMTQEARYIELLRQAVVTEVLGNQLKLYDGSGRHILTFEVLVQLR